MKFAVSLAFLAAVAAAQDTVTVEGVVVNKVTGAGIGDATVLLIGPTAGRYETHTDASGSLRIAGVKPGDYIVSAQRSGYFPDAPETFGAPPKRRIATGGDPVRLRLELNPPAVIRGRVLDADGNPARAAVDLGRGRTVNTNTEGSFVFENLEPGSYTLLARPITLEPASKDEGNRTAVVPTFYPSVVDRNQAESIVVRAGAELGGYEIRLQSVPVYRVRGVVLNPDGTPAAKAIVELQNRSAEKELDAFLSAHGGSQSFSIRTSAAGFSEPEEPFVTREDGMFEFPYVRAGEWLIHAEGDPVWDKVRRVDIASFGSATLTLGHGDPDDVKIQMAAPLRVTGGAVMADGSPVPTGVFMTVDLVSEQGRHSGGAISENSALRVDNVIPGPHQIRVHVTSGNYYADSILLGSADITGRSAELTAASPPIKIVLKPAGTFRGTVDDADAGTVVLFPQSVTGVANAAQTGVDKTFELAGIPPGNYYAIALDHFDPRTMADAVRLRSLMPRATSVRVEQGSATSVQLKVNRLPD